LKLWAKAFSDLETKLAATQAKIESVKKLADNNVRLYRNKANENKILSERLETSNNQVEQSQVVIHNLNHEVSQLTININGLTNDALAKDAIVLQDRVGT